MNYNKLVKNSAWNSGSFVFITLVSFLVLPFIIKKLTIEGYGIYILITSLIGYYGILDLGLGSALVKFTAELKAKNENQLLNTYINSTIIFQGGVGVIASACLLIFSHQILSILNVSQKNFAESIIGIKLCALGFFFTFIASAYKAVLQGLQLYKYTSLLEGSFNLFINVFLVIVLYLGYGLVGAIFINVFMAFCSLTIYYFLARKNLPGYKFVPEIDVVVVKNIFNFSFFVFLSKISGIFSTYLVRFAISIFLGPAAVTYYVVPSKVVGAVGGVASSAVSTIFPFSSQLKAVEKKEEIKKLFLQSTRIFAAVLLPLTLFISLFSKQILTIWMGKEFALQSWMVLSVIAVSSFIGSFSAIPNLIILGQGNSKLIGLFSLMNIVSYLIFIPLLTEMFGIIGTAYSLLITSGIVIIYVLYKTTQYTEITLSEYYVAVIKPHLVIFLLVVVILFPTLLFIQNQNVILLTGGGVLLMSLHYIFLIKRNIIPYKNLFKKLIY